MRLGRSMPRGPLVWRCHQTGLPGYRLHALGPAWVDDDGLRRDVVPHGLVAMPAGSLASWLGYRNQTDAILALQGDARWHAFELFITSSSSVVCIQHGDQMAPVGAKSLGIYFDDPGSLGWLGRQMREEGMA